MKGVISRTETEELDGEVLNEAVRFVFIPGFGAVERIIPAHLLAPLGMEKPLVMKSACLP